MSNLPIIEEEFIQKTRRRSSRRIGGHNPCRASCFVWVFLKQMVELIRLFKKYRGKTASAARILSPNLTRQPSPCLLNKSFFYVAYILTSQFQETAQYPAHHSFFTAVFFRAAGLS